MSILDLVSLYLDRASLLAYPVVFLAGLLTSFTPCIYPLIPIVVGTIGASAPNSRRRALFFSLLYVFGMATTFTLLGGVASICGMIFGEIQSHPFSYLVIGYIIVVFGLSALELIPLPVLKTQRFSLSLLGPFGMGLFSGFITAPCTTPVLGLLLLYVGTRQNILFGTTLLFTFALGFGVLLILAGGFTGSLLPKGGPWMVRIRHGFGYFMIGFGEYLLVKSAHMWGSRGG